MFKRRAMKPITKTQMEVSKAHFLYKDVSMDLVPNSNPLPCSGLAMTQATKKAFRRKSKLAKVNLILLLRSQEGQRYKVRFWVLAPCCISSAVKSLSGRKTFRRDRKMLGIPMASRINKRPAASSQT